MEVFSIILCLLIGVISTVYLFFKKRYSYWKDRGVPYAEPTIPFGNFPWKKVPLKNFFEDLYNQKPDNFPFLGCYLLASHGVCATDLDFIQSVLVKDFSAFHERGLYINEHDDPLSMHMFALDGEKWKSIRSKLSPTFTSGKMKFMFPTVVEVAERFNMVLAEQIGKNPELEIKDLLTRFTTDVIGSCAFGIECNSLNNPESEFRRYGLKIIDEPKLGPLWQFFITQFPNFSRRFHIKTVTQDVENFFLGTVRETIEFREKNKVKRNDFMDLLIHMKNNDSMDDEPMKISEKLSIEEIAAQVFLFFLAGFETSSTTMMFSLYELALNPDIQEKAREEIESVLARHEGKLTYEAVKEMVYVDQIISESLRKYPPVVNLLRRAVRDYPVPHTNATIEKGTMIIIPVYGIHQDPDIYKNPEIFDPERFTPEQIKSRHPMSFLGFGDGPRNCIGLRFGRMQARIGLITLLKNYRIKPSEKTPIPIVFSSKVITVLAPEGGMYLKLENI